VRVWVDVDNAPQVQYLVPLAQGFERSGADVVFTARDHGITLDLMRSRGLRFHAVGAAFSRSKISKAAGVLRRSASLRRLLSGAARPTLLVSASRSSAAAARGMHIPIFIVVDYEYVHLGIYRRLGATLLFPDVIDTDIFRRQGFPAAHLIPFRGIKEDITFADVIVEDIAPHHLTDANEQVVRVLFRPPAEESHYHREASSRISRQLLETLATDPRIVVLLSPRYEWQLEQAESLTWHNEPVLLREAVPFLTLFKAVDLVISAGGTMLREAAYLGVPAYSLFQGSPGAVDRHLQSIGRLEFIRTTDDFDRIRLEKSADATPLRSNPLLIDEIVELVSARAA
jgi:predicted glycosyltransferase